MSLTIKNRVKFRFWDEENKKMLYPDENYEYQINETKKYTLSKMLKLCEDSNRFEPMQNIGLTKCDLYEDDVVEVEINGKRVTGRIRYYGDLPYYHLEVDWLGTDWRPINDGWIYNGYLLGNYYEGKLKEKVKICEGW